jgi:hypothetical protein
MIIAGIKLAGFVSLTLALLSINAPELDRTIIPCVCAFWRASRTIFQIRIGERSGEDTGRDRLEAYSGWPI